VLSLALSPGYADDGVLLAGTESHGMYRSADEGRTWTRLAQETIPGTVNALLLAPGYPDTPHILAAQDDSLLVSRDDGAAWSPWSEDLDLEAGVASLAAPQGLDAGAPLLVGLADGRVLRI
jgi:photosystem II stability/assembly factor-like uncharacterized protein